MKSLWLEGENVDVSPNRQVGIHSSLITLVYQCNILIGTKLLAEVQIQCKFFIYLSFVEVDHSLSFQGSRGFHCCFSSDVHTKEFLSVVDIEGGGGWRGLERLMKLLKLFFYLG